MIKKLIALSKILTILILIGLIITSFVLTHSNKESYAFDTSSEIIMETSSKRVLYEKNCYDKKYMASTTKILTAITVIENTDVNNVVTVTKDTCGIEGSSIYLEDGEKLTVKDLLYGLMLRSGNDCAETLAKFCSGSIGRFAVLMNETAKKAGAKNSNFINPHGLHNDNHYTTAYDLALISSYALKNDIFREIVSTKQIRIPFTTRNTVRVLKNKNKMLFNFDGATGIKTGFTKKAGRCLVTSAKRNNMELVCVVLNCPPMFERSSELLTNAFSDHTNIKLVNSSHIVGFTKYKNKKYCLNIKNDIVLPLTENERKNIKIQYNYPERIENSVKITDPVGNIKIYLKNNLLFEEKIYIIV